MSQRDRLVRRECPVCGTKATYNDSARRDGVAWYCKVHGVVPIEQRVYWAEGTDPRIKELEIQIADMLDFILEVEERLDMEIV